MSLPAELLLPCTELQKQAEELVREVPPCCLAAIVPSSR